MIPAMRSMGVAEWGCGYMIGGWVEVRLYSVLNYNHIRYVRKLTKKVTYTFVCCDFPVKQCLLKLHIVFCTGGTFI